MAVELESEPLRGHADNPPEDPEWAEPRLGVADMTLGATFLDEGASIVDEELAYERG
jgi:hypothetical protein